jgi:hypothetical protein
MKILGIFCSLILLAGAERLEEEVAKLTTEYHKLEGYQISYDGLTQDGKKGVFKAGVDFKSGWAYSIMDVQDEDGMPLMRSEQWSTGEGDFVMVQNGKAVVYEGFGKMQTRFDELKKLLSKKAEPSEWKLSLSLHLTRDRVQTSIASGSSKPAWLENHLAIKASNEDEIELDWGENGIITVDRKSGLMMSQEIVVAGGQRTLKVIDWKKNPGEEAIAASMQVALDGAPRRDIAELGMFQDLLLKVFQQFILESGKLKNEGELEALLEKIEDDFVEFLKGEPFDEAPFGPDETLFKAFDLFVEQVQEKAEEKGQKVETHAILSNAKLRRTLETSLAKSLLKKAPPEAKEKILKQLLGSDLKARERQEIAARRTIHAFLIQSFVKTKISRAIDSHLKMF